MNLPIELLRVIAHYVPYKEFIAFLRVNKMSLKQRMTHHCEITNTCRINDDLLAMKNTFNQNNFGLRPIHTIVTYSIAPISLFLNAIDLSNPKNYDILHFIFTNSLKNKCVIIVICSKYIQSHTPLKINIPKKIMILLAQYDHLLSLNQKVEFVNACF